MKFELARPFIITPRLLPGVEIGGAFLSITYLKRGDDGRTHYEVWIDLPQGKPHRDTSLRSGCGGGDLQEGMASLLSFLGAAAESYRYAGMQGENADLFPRRVVEWAYQRSDEISALEFEIENADTSFIKETAT